MSRKQNSLVICRVCGHRIARNASQCPYCGNLSRREGERRRKHENRISAIKAIVILFGIALIVFAFLFLTGSCQLVLTPIR